MSPENERSPVENDSAALGAGSGSPASGVDSPARVSEVEMRLLNSAIEARTQAAQAFDQVNAQFREAEARLQQAIGAAAHLSRSIAATYQLGPKDGLDPDGTIHRGESLLTSQGIPPDLSGLIPPVTGDNSTDPPESAGDRGQLAEPSNNRRFWGHKR